MLGPYAQNKLRDAIWHCLWGAGLLAGLQNPADSLGALSYIYIAES